MIKYRVLLPHSAFDDMKWPFHIRLALDKAFGKENVSFIHSRRTRDAHFIVHASNKPLVTKFLLTNTDGLEFEEDPRV